MLDQWKIYLLILFVSKDLTSLLAIRPPETITTIIIETKLKSWLNKNNIDYNQTSNMVQNVHPSWFRSDSDRRILFSLYMYIQTLIIVPWICSSLNLFLSFYKYSVMINLQNHRVYLLQDKNNQQRQRSLQDARINKRSEIHVQVHSEMLVIHHSARTNY